MKSVPLNAYPRGLTRRAGAKSLRASGRIPAVVYGRQRATENLEVVAKELEDLIHHSVTENLLVDLSIKDDSQPKRLALVQEVQHHPLSGKILHVDFHEVSADEKVTVMVPVEATGEAVGVKTGGGVLEHVMFKVKVRGLPKDLPEFIMVDVSHLEIGQAIHIGDIKPLPGTEILGDKHISVIAVAAPRAEEVEAVAAETPLAAGDVEMIKEKKEGGEEEAPAKGSEKGAEKTPAKGAAKGAEKAPAKGAEKAPAKGAEKGAAKAPEKGAEKKAEKPGKK